MSPQFAGIACAMSNNLYDKIGIELKFLPICPVGLELHRVRENADEKNSDASSLTVGSVEQNIFIPTLSRNPELRVKAVAAMFRRSPLCLASLKSAESKGEAVVGAHEDTVSLLERILNSETSNSNKKLSVIASARSSKNTDLMKGDVDFIQAYTTTEVPTLEKLTQNDVAFEMLEGMNGAKLGYSQTLFSPEEDLKDKDKREVLESFLDATFSGWEMAIRDVESAAKNVEEAKSMLRLDDENNDHWDKSFEYTVQSAGLCCDYVKETFQGDRYGVIDSRRWNEATDWLLTEKGHGGGGGGGVNNNFGLDPDIWQPSPKLLAGNELARRELSKAKESAEKFRSANGRKPSLAVITVGELSRYTNAKRRLKIYSNDANSWFNKAWVGESNGFEVKEINLAEDTSTDDLLSELYGLKGFDGIQLMWPMPAHIDAGKVYNAIDIRQDVDGAHYIGQRELDSKSSAMPPVTPAAVIDLIDEYSMEVKNKHVLVVGRSRIVGSPMAFMLRERGAIVTVVHSEVTEDNLEALVRSADIVISCAGYPGSMKAEWLKADSEVINVGTTFCEEKDTLVSDFEGDISKFAKRFSPVPGGIGPTSVASLFKNVATAAWERARERDDIDSTWSRRSASIHRTIHFKDYNAALEFANKVNAMSTEMDHHANMSFNHRCVNGVDATLEFFTFEANDLTDKDYEAARRVNAILDDENIRMSDYTYDLKLDSIAKFPAEPRGSSRLVRVDKDGRVQHYAHFSQEILSLIEGSHIIFNESKVVNARLSVSGNTAEDIEMMILDLGDNLQRDCSDAKLKVMIREEDVRCGEIYSLPRAKFRVSQVIGPWIEDENSDGNGTECVVECLTEDVMTVACLLDSVGTVPIPPYLNRKADTSDISAYNNVFAAGEGSVAAPTAGLHFTDQLLAEIGQENISFLTLHVGAGTFKPVVTENAYDHAMHSETFAVNVGEIQRIIESLQNGKQLVVVGTTSSRTLESLYWCGVKILKNMERGDNTEENRMELGQHEWRGLDSREITAIDALKAVIDGKRSADSVFGRTSLMIAKGYDFKVVENLITNFHAPDSTLMLLVSTFLGSGDKVREVYHEAQELGYKFLSYGDVCLFSRPKSKK